MQALWNIAPWMRRRAQRHIERGSSARVMHYILSTSGSDPAEVPTAVSATNVDNVILFRALRGARATDHPAQDG